jgi:YfiH family protein
MSALYEVIPHFYSFTAWKDFPLVAGFTDRYYDFTPGVQPDKKRNFLKDLSIETSHVIFPKQIHRNTVICVTPNTLLYEEADALITREISLPIGIITADCVPLFLYDPLVKCAALIHAGWKGLRHGIVPLTIAKMTEHFNSSPSNIFVGIGPCIHQCCFEVQPDVAAYFPDSTHSRSGKIFVDLVDVSMRNLTQCGVNPCNISIADFCTSCRTDLFFSYRREGSHTGRIASLMMLE